MENLTNEIATNIDDTNIINPTFNNIYFPYTPYENQKKLINSIIHTLENKKAGIFESPTGTGKSLCLLSSILHYLDQVNFRNKNQSESDWLNDFGGKPVNTKPQKRTINISTNMLTTKHLNINNSSLVTKVIKSGELEEIKEMLIDIESKQNKLGYSNPEKLQILYCTRTHSQISQVVSEIKKIRDKANINYKISILGSRKLLCINTQVNNKLTSIYQINEKCIDLQKSKIESCPAKKNIDLLSSTILENIFDVEELHKLGTLQNICPYYASRESFYDADIVLLPYNAILNSKIRSSYELSLKNKIIIFDEAHNISDSLLQTYNSEISIDSLIIVIIQLNLYYEKYGERLKAKSNMFIRQLIKVAESTLYFLFGYKNVDNFRNSNKKEVLGVIEFLIEADISNMDFYQIIKYLDVCDLGLKLRWIWERFIKDLKNDCNQLNDKKRNNYKESNKLEKTESVIDKKPFYITDLIKKYFSNYNKYKDIFLDIDLLKTNNINRDYFNQFTEFLQNLTYLEEDGKMIVSKHSSVFTCLQISKLNFYMLNANKEFDFIIKHSKCILFVG